MENLTHWCFEWMWVEETEIASAGIFLGAIKGTHHCCVTLGLWARAVSHWRQWQVSVGESRVTLWQNKFWQLSCSFFLSEILFVNLLPAGAPGPWLSWQRVGLYINSFTKQNLGPLCCCCHKVLHKLLPALLTKVWSLLPQGVAELWVHLLALASLNSFNLPISTFSHSKHWILY